MPTYKAPVADTMFLLTDVFPIENYRNLPQFAEASLDLVEAVLNEGGKFAAGGQAGLCLFLLCCSWNALVWLKYVCNSASKR